MKPLDLNPTHPIHPLLQGVFWLLLGLCFTVSILTARSWFSLISAIGLVCLVYARWIEPRWLSTKHLHLSLKKDATKTLKIVFLSDFHAGHPKDEGFFMRVVKRTKQEKPDLILLGGDFVEEKSEHMSELKALKNLKARHGVFAILGNHDFIDNPKKIMTTLEQWGIKDITNQRATLMSDPPVELMGLEDNWFGKPDLGLLEGPKPQMPRILLIHEPDELLEIKEGDADLIFIGHTHGGQVRLPGVGPLTPLPQQVSRRYDRGLRHWKGIPVIISQGLGESLFRIRFFCRPQIVVVNVEV